MDQMALARPMSGSTLCKASSRKQEAGIERRNDVKQARNDMEQREEDGGSCVQYGGFAYTVCGR